MVFSFSFHIIPIWAVVSLAALLMGRSYSPEYHGSVTLTTINDFFYCPPLRVNETEALREKGQGEITGKVHRAG